MSQTVAPKEPAGVGVEVSTEQLQQILANKSEPVVDVRTPKEYAIAHIPGSIHIYEKNLEKLKQLLPDKQAGMVIYCNGPYCHKVKRVAEKLFKEGYTNIKRYQLGLPVWRSYGNTVQTDLAGCKYIFPADKTAVWVDARPKEEFVKGSVPGAVNVQSGEVKVANDDGRLPYTDKGTRIVVFADQPEAARKVAAEIAHTAYWNSSYFSGTFVDLRAAGLW